MTVGYPKIAIIGAGISGLALACVLHKGGIPYTIYEGEESLTSRKQGGPVNVHYDTGERILRAFGLFEEYKKSTYTPRCEVNSLGDRHGKLWLYHSEEEGILYPGGGAPLVDRVELQRLLLGAQQILYSGPPKSRAFYQQRTIPMISCFRTAHLHLAFTSL